MNSETTYPDPDIAAMRQAITRDLETWTGRAWVPRYARLEFPGTGTHELRLTDGITRLSDGTRLRTPGIIMDTVRVLNATVGGVSVTTSDIKLIGSKLVRTDATWTHPTTTDPLNVVVELEYGLEPYTDGSDRIGLLILRDRLVASNISDRASSFTDELGNYSFVTAGVRGAVSNIPEVNRWVQDHKVKVYVY